MRTGQAPSQSSSTGAAQAAAARAPIVRTPFRENPGSRYQASSAAQMLCFGSQVTAQPFLARLRVR